MIQELEQETMSEAARQEGNDRCDGFIRRGCHMDRSEVDAGPFEVQRNVRCLLATSFR